MADCVDIVILSNAPGELTTWVYPVLQRFSQYFIDHPTISPRISIVLSPCTNSSGQEAAIATSYANVDRVIAAEDFWQFLLWGKTPNLDWDWHKQGVVIFLGGDQIYPVVIGKRLGYTTLIYAEWSARWLGWIDRFAVRNEQVAKTIPEPYQAKVEVVGDLMVDIFDERPALIDSPNLQSELIVLMPGSKSMKLRQGVPLCLGIADEISQKRPQTKFAIALAPTLSPKVLASYAQPHLVVDLVEGTTAELVQRQDGYVLKTLNGTEIEVYTKFPAHDLLRNCQLCITTVGANTAELAALAVPMIVLLPTNQIDAMRGWDGLLGILTNLPIFGDGFAKVINRVMLRNLKLLAWPNIWAGEEIVPELFGHLTSQGVAKFLLENLLEQPEKLQTMRDRLRKVSGQPGAAQKIVDIAMQTLKY